MSARGGWRDVAVEPLDKVTRRARRHGDAAPRERFIAVDAGLGDSRHFRHRGCALEPGDRKRGGLCLP